MFHIILNKVFIIIIYKNNDCDLVASFLFSPFQLSNYL